MHPRTPAETPRLRGAGFVAATLAFVALVSATPARAEDAGDAAARAAVSATRRDARSKDRVVRARASAALGGTDHAVAAKELLARLRVETEPSVQRAIVEALATQRAARADVVTRLLPWIAAQAEADRRREGRGDPGFPVDPRTGDPLLASPEGQAALARGTDAGAARAAALRLVAADERVLAEHAGEWIPFLQDAHDDLVVCVLEALGRARRADALPAILELYRMYPTAASWETGSVVDRAGTNATAKASWMVRFGHPGKQRARPRVHEAVGTALAAITGSAQDSPEALAAWMAKPAERRKGS
jgi:hypothetical protein